MNPATPGAWGRGGGWLALAPLVAVVCGCEPPDRLVLPGLVNIVVQLESREYVSLLVTLDAPRRRPAVRVAPGLVSYDGHRIIEVSTWPHLSPDGALVRELEVHDLLRDRRVIVTVEPGGELDDRLDVVNLGDREARLRLRPAAGGETMSVLDLVTGELTEAEPAVPTATYARLGPDRGFSVRLEGSRLVLGLPHADGGGDLPLLDQTDHIVAVHWIGEEAVPWGRLDPLQARFKSAGSVVASAQDCVADGDLGEWSGDEALAVEGLGHVERGGHLWQGVRDASFALAARLSPDALCLAIRIRDDHLLEGRDLLVLDTGEARFELPLPAGPTEEEHDGLRIAFTDRATFGVGAELRLHPAIWTVRDGNVPLRVLYSDADPGEDPVLLASAPDVPWAALAGVRLPRRGREGVPSR
ncbi:MAG: hypothetical protein ABIO70_34085 [Pseudomonadota bacterium]